MLYRFWRWLRGKIQRCFICERRRDIESCCPHCGDHPLGCDCAFCCAVLDDDGGISMPGSEGKPTMNDLYGYLKELEEDDDA